MKRNIMLKIFFTTLLILLCITFCKRQTNNKLYGLQSDISEREAVTTENNRAYISHETVETSTSVTETTTEEQHLSLSDVRQMPAGTILSSDDLSEIETSHLFYMESIDDDILSRIDGISYSEDCIISLDDLRYLRVLHIGFDGETHIGELICNRELSEDFLEIFSKLYKYKYPIEKMLLVDEYKGDDEASMEDNNTSCFNFRHVPGSDHLSQHAYGRAIDINPLYNPYVTSEGFTPYNAEEYLDRSKDFPYKIYSDDYCYELFTDYGFTWGGNWNSVKDYQHFQKKEEN